MTHPVTGRAETLISRSNVAVNTIISVKPNVLTPTQRLPSVVMG